MSTNVLYEQAKQRISETAALWKWEEVLLTDWHDFGGVLYLVATGSVEEIITWLKESGYDVNGNDTQSSKSILSMKA